MNQDYTQSVNAKSTSNRAFLAITQEIDKWWGSVDAPITQAGDIFTITFGHAYWTFKITEYIPNKSVVWQCIDGQPELNNEWIGHNLKWMIHNNDDMTTISFNQSGLNPTLPCYDICSAAWDSFILISLKEYLETGNGSPR